MGNKPIVHAPIATGSTEPRDIRDRFADFVNLKDFGAAGDGITDDSAAWAAWQTALENGGSLYIPAGDYLLGSELLRAPKGYISDNCKTYTYDSSDTVINALFNAGIFVNASTGDDSNDGLTKATAVKTISEGLNKLRKQAVSDLAQTLYIAGGSYTEDVEITNSNINILLDGTVNLTGRITVTNSYTVIRQTSSGSLNITNSNASALYVQYHSRLGISCNTVINCSNTANAIVVRLFAVLTFNSGYSLAITGNSISDALVIASQRAFLLIESTFTIQGSSIAKGVDAIHFSYIQITNGITCSSGITNNSIYSARFSTVVINGDCILYGTAPIFSTWYSYIGIGGYNTLNINRTGSSNSIHASTYSTVEISPANSSSTLTLALGNSTSGSGINAQNYGTVLVNSTGKIAFSGKCGIVASSHTHSYIVIGSSNTISGSVTGKKYEAKTYGQINVGGAGANRIPGNTAGTVETSSYGLYS